jgi:methyl-accepting chemotaxis protein
VSHVASRTHLSARRFLTCVEGSNVTWGVLAIALLGVGAAAGSTAVVAAAVVLVAFAVVANMADLAFIGFTFTKLVRALRTGAGLLGSAAAEMRRVRAESAAASAEQCAAVAETSTSIEHLAANAATIAENADSVASAAAQTVETMRQMQETVDAIRGRSLRLNESSERIGVMLALIDEIAEQTNLLALNAAIEAARASDAGRGFAVIAAEVRTLAERSLAASESIAEIIERIRAKTAETISASDQGTRLAGEVAELMERTTRMLDESILATQQQKSAADQVAVIVGEIRVAAESLAGRGEQQADVARRLDERAGQLAESVLQLGAAASDRALPPGYVRRQLRESVLPLALIAVTAVVVSVFAHRPGLLAAELVPGAIAAVFMASARAYRVRRLLRFGAGTRAAVADLRRLSRETRHGSAGMATAAAEQSAAVAEISTTIHQLATTAGAIAENSRGVADAAKRTIDTLVDMQETVEAIAGRSRLLGEESRQIGDIVAVIGEIAERTNMLALAAEIEAARGNEAGKGFRIVAGEVRRLAERSLQSTASIREIVQTIQVETAETVAATESGADQVHGVAELLGRTATMLDDSILAALQQQSAAEQVGAAMAQIKAEARRHADEDDSAVLAPVEEAVATLERATESILMRGPSSDPSAATASARRVALSPS